jgi:hypothetical protein
MPDALRSEETVVLFHKHTLATTRAVMGLINQDFIPINVHVVRQFICIPVNVTLGAHVGRLGVLESRLGRVFIRNEVTGITVTTRVIAVHSQTAQ